MAHPAVGGDTICSPYPYALGRVEVQFSNSLARRTYLAYMPCVGAFNLRYDGSNSWVLIDGNEEPTTHDSVLVEGDPTTTPCLVEMTATGTTPGGVTLEFRRESGGMVARYKNLSLWQPHVKSWFRLVDYDLTATALRWNPYIWVEPRNVSNCNSPGGEVQVYGWIVSGLEAYGIAGEVGLEPYGPNITGDCGGCGFRGGAVELCMASVDGETATGTTLQINDIQVSGDQFPDPLLLDGSSATLELDLGGFATITPIVGGVPFEDITCNPPPPESCNCDTATGSLQFEISGMADGGLNGTWGAGKNFDPCEPTGCCWGSLGGSPDTQHTVVITNSLVDDHQTWIVSIDSGTVVYEAIGVVCDLPETLSKTVDTSGEDYPDTIVLETS